MIDFYSAGTPNGHKVSIALEEMGIAYELKQVELAKLEQKSPEFLKLNPNGRIPVIVDRAEGDFAVFESGAILIYLAEKTGLLMPKDPKGRSLVMQWLMFQMSGIGPMMGQANVFFRYMPEKIPVAIERYQNECVRLFGVLNERLADQAFLAGDYSIADIATYPWVRTHAWSGIEIKPFPHLERWLNEITARPAVTRGLDRPPLTIRLDQIDTDADAAENFKAEARNLLSPANTRRT